MSPLSSLLQCWSPGLATTTVVPLESRPFHDVPSTAHEGVQAADAQQWHVISKASPLTKGVVSSYSLTDSQRQRDALSNSSLPIFQLADGQSSFNGTATATISVTQPATSPSQHQQQQPRFICQLFLVTPVHEARDGEQSLSPSDCLHLPMYLARASEGWDGGDTITSVRVKPCAANDAARTALDVTEGLMGFCTFMRDMANLDSALLTLLADVALSVASPDYAPSKCTSTSQTYRSAQTLSMFPAPYDSIRVSSSYIRDPKDATLRPALVLELVETSIAEPQSFLADVPQVHTHKSASNGIMAVPLGPKQADAMRAAAMMMAARCMGTLMELNVEQAPAAAGSGGRLATSHRLSSRHSSEVALHAVNRGAASVGKMLVSGRVLLQNEASQEYWGKLSPRKEGGSLQLLTSLMEMKPDALPALLEQLQQQQQQEEQQQQQGRPCWTMVVQVRRNAHTVGTPCDKPSVDHSSGALACSDAGGKLFELEEVQEFYKASIAACWSRTNSAGVCSPREVIMGGGAGAPLAASPRHTDSSSSNTARRGVRKMPSGHPVTEAHSGFQGLPDHEEADRKISICDPMGRVVEDREEDHYEQEEQQGEDTVWHEVQVLTVRDPVTGKKALLLMQTDITARIGMEQKMAQATATQLSMLENMYPRHVLEYFMNAGTTPSTNFEGLAFQHDGVSILFMDIVGFTSMSKEVAPHIVMGFLNELFSRFDRLCDYHNVFKVETAGDCYIVAGALMMCDSKGFTVLDQDADMHVGARNIVNFAEAMLRHAQTVTMPHNGQPTSVRVGIHTGSVVSGLIGTKLPKFGLFGDTMNTSSRMESTSKPGCIQISETTHAIMDVDQQHLFTPSGGVHVKGKGLMPTYLYTPSQEDLRLRPEDLALIQEGKAMEAEELEEPDDEKLIMEELRLLPSMISDPEPAAPALRTAAVCSGSAFGAAAGPAVPSRPVSRHLSRHFSRGFSGAFNAEAAWRSALSEVKRQPSTTMQMARQADCSRTEHAKASDVDVHFADSLEMSAERRNSSLQREDLTTLKRQSSLYHTSGAGPNRPRNARRGSIIMAYTSAVIAARQWDPSYLAPTPSEHSLTNRIKSELSESRARTFGSGISYQ